MNSVHFMLADRELSLLNIIEKLNRSAVSVEDHISLHAAESELSEIKMARQILDEYEAEHFPMIPPSDFPFSCH